MAYPPVIPLSSAARSAAWSPILVDQVGDRPLHAFAATYLAAATLLGFMLGAPERVVPLIYLPLWTAGPIEGVLAYLLVWQVPRAVRGGSPRPFTDAVMLTQAEFRPRLISGLALLLSTALVFGSFTSIKNMLPILSPTWIDRPLADLGASLHGGRDAWQWLHPLIGYPAVTRIIEILYAPVWFSLLAGITTFMAFHRGMAHVRTRYFLTLFLCLAVLGNVLAGLVMSAGPVYYGHVTGDDGRFGELVRYLSFSRGLPHSAWDYQEYLWNVFRSGRVELASGISAFPSIHVSLATLFALAGWSLGRRYGILLTGNWLLIQVGSVHLGWHYALDGYTSTLGTVALWGLAGWLVRRASVAREDLAARRARIRLAGVQAFRARSGKAVAAR